MSPLTDKYHIIRVGPQNQAVKVQFVADNITICCEASIIIPLPNEVVVVVVVGGGCGEGYTGITLSVCLSVCPSVGDMVSGA